MEGPTNSLVCPMLTDLYQITMAFAYWKANRHNDHAVFDLFFRKNPFKGEYCIFAGLDEAIKFIRTFHFSASDIEYLKSVMVTADDAFFDYLKDLTCKEMKIYSVEDGTVMEPIISSSPNYLEFAGGIPQNTFD